MDKSAKQKFTIGFLILVLLTSSIYLLLPDKVRIDVEKTRTLFKVYEDDSWVLGATEYVNLFSGSTKMRAWYRDVQSDVNGDIITITRTSKWKDNITTIDTYTFDSSVSDVEQVPVDHTVTCINCIGKIVHFEYRDILYTGETKHITSPFSFGHNMKLDWDDVRNDFSWAKVYQQKTVSDKIIIRYKPTSNYENYDVRLFDPPVTVITSTNSGQYTGDGTWMNHVFYDRNNNRWHVTYINNIGNLYSYSSSDGTSWISGGVEIANTFNGYENYECVIDHNGTNTYLHCVYSYGGTDQLFYKRCTLTGTSTYISCGTQETIFDASEMGQNALDDVSAPHIILDEDRCVVVGFDFEDDSEVTGDEHEIVLTRENKSSTCGDGDWDFATDTEEGFPIYSIQNETGYNQPTAVGLTSFGDNDAQIFWFNTDDAILNARLCTAYFNGSSNTTGFHIDIHNDIQFDVIGEHAASVSFQGNSTATFACNDTITNVYAFITRGKNTGLYSTVDTGIDANCTVQGATDSVITAVVDTRAPGEDDIYVFSLDDDQVDIYYTYTTDGGTTFETPVLWVDGINNGTSFLTSYFNNETCDIIVSWVGNSSSPYAIETYILNTGSCDATTAIVNITLVNPTGNDNFTKDAWNEFEVRVCCFNDDCGEINVSLDPTIILNISDTEILEDTWVGDQYPTNDFGDEIYLALMNSSSLGSYTRWIPIKYNITTIPDATITDAQFCGWIYLNDFGVDTEGINTTIYMINESINWTESDMNWNSRPNSSNLHIPEGNFDYFGGVSKPIDEWICYNITNIVDYHKTNNIINLSLMILSWEYGSPSVSDKIYLASKEHTTLPAPELRITYLSKDGLIPEDSGTPFYVNSSNPINITLNKDECQNVKWYVNATGTNDTTYEFYAFANITSNMSLNNITTKINITILEEEEEIETPLLNITLVTPIIDANFTQNEFTSFNVTVCCSGINCGDVNVSLDPVDTLNIANIDILEDTYVNNYTGKYDTNYGSETILRITNSTVLTLRYIQRTFVKFGIYSIPRGATITNVEYGVWATYVNGNGEFNLSVYHVYNKTWKEDVITWNNQPCGSDFDQSDQCNLTRESYRTANGGDDGEWLTWNVTKSFTNEYNQNSPYLSLVTKADEGYNAIFTSNPSKETLGHPDFKPYLKVTYTGGDSSKGGLVSNVSGEQPFWLNTTNPVVISSLNVDTCQDVGWWVNATGEVGLVREFFAYVNKSSNGSINNISETINITITDASVIDYLNITFLTPTGNDNFTQDEFTTVTVEVCCENVGNCGTINVSLDPITRNINDGYFIIVDSDVYYGTTNVTASLDTYITYLEQERYVVETHICNRSSYCNYTWVREVLWNGTLNDNLVGATLVGNIPSPLYEVHFLSPSEVVTNGTIDTYYMDLNDTFEDNYYWTGSSWASGTNGVWDTRVGDHTAEIYVGRITPVNSTDNITFINNYFQKTFNFRERTLTTPINEGTGLVFMDDDFIEEINARTEALSNVVSFDNMYYNIDTIGTNKTNYLANLTDGYEFILLDSHSNNFAHYLYPGPEFIYYEDLMTTDSDSLFIDLHSCGPCKWVYGADLDIYVEDYLCSGYIFTNSNTVILLAATNTMDANYPTAPYYTALGNGDTVGEAFKANYDGKKGTNYTYSMSIWGDPTLRAYSQMSNKGGLISNVSGDMPFWLNTTNPVTTASLNMGQCENVTWWVNATGGVNFTYEFFAFANETSDLSKSDITDTYNITISESGDASCTQNSNCAAGEYCSQGQTCETDKGTGYECGDDITYLDTDVENNGACTSAYCRTTIGGSDNDKYCADSSTDCVDYDGSEPANSRNNGYEACEGTDFDYVCTSGTWSSANACPDQTCSGASNVDSYLIDSTCSESTGCTSQTSTECPTCNTCSGTSCVIKSDHTQDTIGSNLCTGLCDECNDVGSCTDQDAGQDYFNDCEVGYSACDNEYIRRGGDGTCGGGATCDTSGAALNVSAGNVCISGADADPTTGVNCGTWSDCVSGSCSATEYWVGYTGDGTATCVDTDWQASGGTAYTGMNLSISATNHVDTCSQSTSNPCSTDDTCTDYWLFADKLCNDAGGCTIAINPTPCSNNFECNTSTTCKTTCTDQTNCRDNDYYCNTGGNACVGDEILQGTCVGVAYSGTNDEVCDKISGTAICDDDGVGLADDDWCFEPTGTYFDSEDSACEYSASAQSVSTDERQTGYGFTTCNAVGQTYFADNVSSTCTVIDDTSNVCRSSAFDGTCDGDSGCNGVTAGTGGCSASCDYTPGNTAPINTITEPTGSPTYDVDNCVIQVNYTYKAIDLENATLDFTLEHNLSGSYALIASNNTINNNTNVYNLYSYTTCGNYCARINSTDDELSDSDLTCYDITNSSIENTAPTIQESIISPTNPHLFQNVLFYCNATDIEGDNLTYNFKLFKNDFIYLSENNGKCYQEFANESGCGGASSNAYAFSGLVNWDGGSPSYAYDGDWGTTDQQTYCSPFGTFCYFYPKYVKPNGYVNGSKVIWKSGSQGSSIHNETIPESCLTDINVSFKYTVHRNSDAGLRYTQLDCYNSSSQWEFIQNNTGTEEFWFWEEAVEWYISFDENIDALVYNLSSQYTSLNENWTLECQASDGSLTSSKLNSTTHDISGCDETSDCAASFYCNLTQYCVSDLSDGSNCDGITYDGTQSSEDSACNSGYCDSDGVGLSDDGHCFDVYDTYFDGQEIFNCEYSTDAGSIAADERQVNDNLGTCNNVGFTYFDDVVGSSCDILDNSSNMCRSSAFDGTCTADSSCNGVTAGTGSCSSVCVFSDSDIGLVLGGLDYDLTAEPGSRINVSANKSGSTICVDINHSIFGTNYKCATNETNFTLTISNFDTISLNDSSTTKNLTYSTSENKTVYISSHQYDTVENIFMNLTGFEVSGDYPQNVKIYINDSLSNELGNPFDLNIVKFSDDTTYKNITWNTEQTKLSGYINIQEDTTITAATINLSGHNYTYLQEDTAFITYSGDFSNQAENAYDGSYSTYAITTPNGVGIINFNYTKPSNVINKSVWRIKDFDDELNITIPNTCWEQDNLQFKVNISSNPAAIFDSLGSNGYTAADWTVSDGGSVSFGYYDFESEGYAYMRESYLVNAYAYVQSKELDLSIGYTDVDASVKLGAWHNDGTTGFGCNPDSTCIYTQAAYSCNGGSSWTTIGSETAGGDPDNEFITTSFDIDNVCGGFPDDFRIGFKTSFEASPFSAIVRLYYKDVIITGNPNANVTWSCYNGSNWEILRNKKYTGSNANLNAKVYEESMYWISYPKDPWLEVGSIDGDREFNDTGNYSSINISNDFTTEMNDYLSGCTYVNGYCDVPLYLRSDSIGQINLFNINITYTLDINPVSLNVLLFQDYLDASSGFTNVPIIFESSQQGKIQINDIKYYYLGGNKTYEVKAHTTDYSDNKSYDITFYYSGWDYNLPNNLEYLDWFPPSPTSKNVSPFGQTTTIPILNITGYNYGGKNFNYSIYLNGTSCVNLTASNTSEVSNGQVINDSWYYLKRNVDYLDYFGVWLFGDYTCDYYNSQYWSPDINIRACCEGCDVCDTSIE